MAAIPAYTVEVQTYARGASDRIQISNRAGYFSRLIERLAGSPTPSHNKFLLPP